MNTPKTSGCALEALADRVEALTGPDREVDRLIYEFLNPTHISVKGMSSRYYDPSRINMLSAQKYITKWTYFASRYTASLDAAMVLVPEGCLFTARTVWDNMKPAGLGFVSRYEKGEFSGHERLYWMDEHQAVAATPALALCAAALRARARQATSAAIGGETQPRDPSSYEKESDNG